MKPLKFIRLKPETLPTDPDILDYLEHGFQWLISWVVINIEGHPCVSGMCTALLLSVPYLIAMLIMSLTFHR
jgi:hypothetical protein